MLQNNKLNEIIRTIVQNLNPVKVILFGSYAYGNPTKDSDLDLMILVDNSNLPRYQRARGIRKLLWGKTDTPKDIIIYTVEETNKWLPVKGSLVFNVFNKGEILYEREKGFNTKLAF